MLGGEEVECGGDGGGLLGVSDARLLLLLLRLALSAYFSGPISDQMFVHCFFLSPGLNSTAWQMARGGRRI